jgi:hypothetical protein
MLAIAALASASSGAAQVETGKPASEPGENAVTAMSTAANDCPERYLILHPEPSLQEAFANEIAVDLAAELQQRSIALCKVQRSDVPPLALVTLRQTEALLGIELVDRMTRKRVQRDLSLSKIPEAGRALAAAIAVDELLRASWAELTMKTSREQAERPAPEPVPEPTSLLEPRITPRQEQPARWGAATIALGYGHGPESWDALLVGANLSLWPRSWLWLQLGIFGLRTRTVDAPLGKLSARGMLAELTLGGCPWNGRRLFACAGVRAGAERVAFRAEADQALASARNRGAAGAYLQGVTALGMALGHHLLLAAELALGGPLQQVVATDGDTHLLGTRGPLWTMSLGFGVTP